MFDIAPFPPIMFESALKVMYYGWKAVFAVLKGLP